MGIKNFIIRVFNTYSLMRLFVIALSLIFIFPLFGDDIPAIFMEFYPNAPEFGELWRVIITVDHNVPQEVFVIEPAFLHKEGAEPILQINGIRKYSEFKNFRFQTIIEYKFTPVATGQFTLDPFRIFTPFGYTETEMHIFEIGGVDRRQNIAANSNISGPVVKLQMFWEREQKTANNIRMARGEQAVILLRFRELPPDRLMTQIKKLPDLYFMPDIPKGVIISSLPVSDTEKSDGILLKILLVPLDEDINLTERIIKYENMNITIPELKIRVLGIFENSNNKNEISEINDNVSEIENIKILPVLPEFDFFDFSGYDINKWKDQSEKIYNDILDLWNNGLYAQALAKIRQKERDHPAGAFFKLLRIKAEEELDLFNMGNESIWRRHILLIFILFIFFIVIILPLSCFLFLRKSILRGGKKRNYTVLIKISVLLIITGLSFLCSAYLERSVEPGNLFSKKNGKQGVVCETAVRRTADDYGEAIFNFNEGQPVFIDLDSGSWVYVRSNDIRSKSGWIHAVDVIRY